MNKKTIMKIKERVTAGRLQNDMNPSNGIFLLRRKTWIAKGIFKVFIET